MKFALSSCWNSHRHDDGYPMLREISELGFDYVELSHGVRISLVPGIFRALNEGWIKVSSVHNFCPLPVGVNGAAPNLYEPNAPSARERIMWLTQTQRTIDFARQIDCDLMVIHSGRIRFRLRKPDQRFETAREKDRDESSLAPKRERLLKILSKQQGPYWDWLSESFHRIAEHCTQAGVRVGVENREGLTEMPLDQEMAAFLDQFAEHPVFGYWHDSGHAQIKHEMGFLDHGAFLSSLRPKLFGFHLHDVSAEEKDHQSPGSGIIDWDMIARHVRIHDIVVMEMSPRLRSAQIAEGKAFLEQKIPLLHMSHG